MRIVLYGASKYAFPENRTMQLTSQMIQLHVYRTSGGNIEYLLLKRTNVEPIYPNLWQVVTGMIESGETAMDAARREIFEETGYQPADLYVLPYVASFFNPKTDQVNFVPVFAAEVAKDVPVALSEEHQDYFWAGFETALEMLELPSHREGTRILTETLKRSSMDRFIY